VSNVQFPPHGEARDNLYCAASAKANLLAAIHLLESAVEDLSTIEAEATAATVHDVLRFARIARDEVFALLKAPA
jgi:hypothetical protein